MLLVLCVRGAGAADEPEIGDLKIEDEEEILSADVGENTEVHHKGIGLGWLYV